MHRIRRSGMARVGGRLWVVAIAAALATPGITLSAQSAVIPGITIGDVVVAEGDIGVTPARLTVNLSAPLTTDTFLTFTTGDGSATSGSDYVRRVGKFRIRAGRSFATVALKVTPDTEAEGDETFTVALTSGGGVPIADGTGTVTIRDDEFAEPGRIAIGDASVSESDAGLIPLRFTVNLDAPSAVDVTARFAAVGATATAGLDFVPRLGRLKIRAGRTFAVVTVKEIGDLDAESTEHFDVVLTEVVGATVTDAIGTGTIVDDDTPLISAPGAPILTSAIAGPANGMLVVSWDPPIDDGGAPVTHYDLEIDRPGEIVVGTSTATATNVVCGSPGVTCTMRVRAVNVAGPGPWSEALGGTTWRAPSAVDLIGSGGNQVVTGVWSAPTDAGDFPVIDYRISRSTDGTNFSFVTSTTVRTASVLCPGERSICWIRVQPRNAAGLGPATDASATTWGRPGAPTLVTIRRIGTLVGLGWTAPADDGGAPIVDYLGERTVDGGLSWISVGSVQFTAPTCPVGISCGFRISAANAIGTGPPSNVLSVGP